MRVNITKITSALSKISDLTAGDKSIPGVLLSISTNQLNVCYSDGHKSLIDVISVETTEEDRMGDVVVGYEPLTRAISNCQPSGIIKVESVEFKFVDNNILRVSADQCLDIIDDDGNITGTKKCANKKMDLIWKEPGADLKASILNRMNYSEIFEGDNTDQLNRKEIIAAFNKTAVEKGKLIYMSVAQNVFVNNQAHMTSVPISGYEITEEEKNEVRNSLQIVGTYTDEAFEEAIKAKTSRLHYPIVLPQAMTKAVANILGRLVSDDIYLYSKDKHLNIFVDNEDEKVGIWIEMPKANKVHVETLKHYEALEYKTYQITFLREFLDNNIKSALNATKSEKVTMEFKTEDNELGLNIIASSSQASIADNYRVLADSVVDPTNDIETRKFDISLKVIADMLAQLKTIYVAMDIDINANNNVCLRLAEIDYDKMEEEYTKARAMTEKLCQEQGIQFNAAETPTPIELKLNYRKNTLVTKQYSLISR